MRVQKVVQKVGQKVVQKVGQKVVQKVQKVVQAIGCWPSWYRLTHAANRCTGQTIAPQAWWRPDSWLTAPAEEHYQRYCIT